MSADAITLVMLTFSSGIFAIAGLLLLYWVRRAENRMAWHWLGFSIGVLLLQSSYEWYRQIVGEAFLPLDEISEGLRAAAAVGLLACVVGCRPVFSLQQRNRELLAVIEERNVIIHQFYEKIALALRQLQIALEIGKPVPFIIEQVAGLNGILQVFLEDLKAGVLLGNKFEVALKTLVEDLCRETSFPIAIQVDASAVQNLSYDVGTELLHITREAVKNSVTHSRAKKGSVVVKKTESALTVEVSDNGRGFEVDLVGAQGHGFGNMVMRARKINARLKVNSQPNKGTVVLLEIPLHENSSNGARPPSTVSGLKAGAQQVGTP